MVRIKHRYLLLNILLPEALKPSTGAIAASALPPSVDFRSPTPSHITAGLLITHLRNSIATHFGDCGLGLTTASLKVIYLSTATSTAIIRCPRQYYRVVWAALTYINELPGIRRGEVGKQCVIQVVRVSGTIRKSEDELLRRAKKDLARAKAEEKATGDDVLGRALGGLSNVSSTPAVRREADEIFEDLDEDEDMEDESE